MNSKQEIQKRLEIDRITDALSDYEQFLAEQAICETRRLDDPRHQLKPVTEKRLAHLVNASVRRENPRWRVARRSLLIAAVLLSIIIATQVGAIRTALGNYFLSRDSESINFSDRIPISSLYDRDVIIPAPQKLPEGYALSGITPFHGLTELLYQNQENDKIWLYIYEDKTSLRIDGEKLNAFYQIFIGGQKVSCLEKHSWMTLIWGDAPAYQITGPLKEKDGLIKMAQNMVESPGSPGENKKLEDD